MSPLVVEVDGRVLRLEGNSVIRIGRAIEADVVLTAGSVSRQHAELRPVDGSWVLVDAASQFGTFVDGRRITEHPITGRTVVSCGPEMPGSTLTITPADQVGSGAGTPGYAPAPPPPAPSPAPPTAVGGAVPPTGASRPVPPSRFAPPAPGQAGPGPSAPGPVPPQAVPAGLDQTQVLAAQGGAPAGYGGPVPQQRTGPDLLLVAEGREHRFRHPAQITIGRRTDCTVVLSDPAASRQHGQVAAVPGGWVYTNASNEGTYLDGRRIQTRSFDERISLRLGHPVAGPEITLVPILSAAEEERRIARKRLGRRLRIAGAVAGVLVAVLVIALVVVTGALWLRDDDGDDAADPGTSQTDDGGADTGPGGLSTAELETAKAATVKIIGESYFLDDPARQRFNYAGSGSIIRSDGLILTNAHVAAPEAPGVVETYGDDAAIANPEYVLISLTDGMTDRNAPPAYRARLVVADGYLDAAVIQIYANADGSELEEELDLPTVPVGDSGDLRSGDPVTVLGFPAVAGSGDTISVTSGVISTIINDPELGEGVEFDTDARISPGNSGGMAVDKDGVLIGLPTSIRFDQGSPVTSGRIRAIDAVTDLIEEAEQTVG